MNILFLNSLGKSKWGGGEKWMITAGKGLMDKGHRVIVACLQDSIIEKKAKDSKLEIFHFNIFGDIAFWKKYPLKTFLKENRIQVLVCCQNKDVRIGAKAARQLNVPAIFSRQGLQNISNKKKYIKPFTEYVDGIITNTLSIKEIYEGYEWFPENFIHVIYNGVEIPDNFKRIDLYERYNLPSDHKIIFSSGRLDYQKGFDLLIDVAVRAKEENLNWQIIVAGKGKLKSDLQSLAERKGVSEAIHFIGFTDEIPGHLDASDVFVLPSRYEGMPNALLESMVIGKASVATDINGASELIEDGISGFLVESENTDQIFTKIKLLLHDHDLRKSMGDQAKKRVVRNFTINQMVDNLEELFTKRIAQNRSA
jgi:glycosyltransferase involved in cell wall biosynthesis